MTDSFHRLETVLANRYVIEQAIGTGGMATVYLAADLKHHRRVAIKVLKPELANALGPERFLREIEIAATLNHPHILTLIDSGAADHVVYYVMPFVEGESLREAIDRQRQLPVEQAVLFAQHVASALDYAHRQGVIHRDIKPENILLHQGEAMVTDFGIALALREAGGERLTHIGLPLGTPKYMSPEQASGSSDVDARSDVYSLGCVLYETLTGHPPFTGTTVQQILARHVTDPAPSVRGARPELAPAVAEAVSRALAKDPQDRFASASDFAAALSDRDVTANARTTARRRLLWASILGGVTAVLIVLLLLVGPSDPIDFQERDWVLIADLNNRTGDPIFDESLNTALTVTLDQSRYINVFPRGRVSEVLRRMGHDSVIKLEESVAQEVALREGIKAVLAPDIAMVDSTYIVSARLLDPNTGVAVQSERADAAGRSEVLNALDDVTRRLRRDLGESLDEIEDHNVALPQATTSSLVALKRFADARVAWNDSRWTDARQLWEEAVSLDSNFAWAHASLGLAIAWLDGPEAAQVHYDKALSAFDRITAKERLWITSLTTEGEESISAMRIYTQQYPDDRDAWYNLGTELMNQHRFEEALEPMSKAIAIDSLFSWSYVNAAMVYDALGRSGEAAAAWERVFTLDPTAEARTAGDLNRSSGFVLVKLGDTARARQRFEKAMSGSLDQQANGHRSLGLLAMLFGRYSTGIEHFQEAIGLNQTDDAPLSEYRNRLYLATALRAKGLTDDFDRELTRASELTQRASMGPVWWAILGKLYARSGSVEHARVVLDTLDGWVLRDSSVFNRGYAELIRGEYQLARGDTEAALNSLRVAHQLLKTNDSRESLAFGYLRHDDLSRAAVTYSEIIEQQSLGSEEQEHWILAHYRLGRIHEALENTEPAIEYYGRFLSQWTEGDDDLAALKDARERLEDLQKSVR